MDTTVLPQRWVEKTASRTLSEATEAVFKSWYGDDRDCAGTAEHGSSPVDREYTGQRHPLPDYGTAAPRRRLAFEQGFFSHRRDVEVIQATPTVMPPAAAAAYLDALWRDPGHPFVVAHTYPSIRLNGAAGYLSVKGPALAVPIHDPDAGKPAPPRPRGRGRYAQLPAPDRDPLEGLTRLEVEVENWGGIEDADFEWAAGRHHSLGSHDILTGGMLVRDIVPTEESLDGKAPGPGARPMVKVTGPSRFIGYFEDVAAATAALQKQVDGAERPDRDYLEPLNPYYDWNLHAYEIEACLVEEGREVVGRVGVRMTRTSASVYSRVATVKPGTRKPVTGYLLSWLTPNWHRDRIVAKVDLSGEGPMYRTG